MDLTQNKVMETLLGGLGLHWPSLAPFYQSGPGSKQKVGIWKTHQLANHPKVKTWIKNGKRENGWERKGEGARAEGGELSSQNSVGSIYFSNFCKRRRRRCSTLKKSCCWQVSGQKDKKQRNSGRFFFLFFILLLIGEVDFLPLLLLVLLFLLEFLTKQRPRDPLLCVLNGRFAWTMRKFKGKSGVLSS